jgi:hypothetical protein
MSEDVAAGSPPVPGYAGHADAVARRLSDAQVRGWVGERLADLAARIDLGPFRERVEKLLMRCEFADQQVVHALEDVRFDDPSLGALVESYDRKLVGAAAGLEKATIEDVPGLIDSIEHAFDERTAAITAALKR